MHSLDHIVEPLRGLALPVTSLALDADNVRKHDQRSIDAIAASLAAFHQRRPIIVQRDGMVVRAGNGLVRAAIQLGWTHVAALVLDDDEAQARAYAIADNRTGDLSAFDPEALAAMLDSLMLDDIDVGALGFSQAEYDVMALQFSHAGHGDAGELPSFEAVETHKPAAPAIPAPYEAPAVPAAPARAAPPAVKTASFVVHEAAYDKLMADLGALSVHYGTPAIGDTLLRAIEVARQAAAGV
jgi:hypothetical protein